MIKLVVDTLGGDGGTITRGYNKTAAKRHGLFKTVNVFNPTELAYKTEKSE